MKKALFLALIVGMFLTPLATAQEVTEPTYDVACADGNTSEWLSTDSKILLIKASGEDGQTEPLAEALLRYDCSEQRLCIHVSPLQNYTIDFSMSGEEEWVKIDGKVEVDGTNTPPDSEMPDFARTNGTWEACFGIGEGQYTIGVHTNVDDGVESQTAGSGDIQILIDCPVTSVELVNFAAYWTNPPSSPITKATLIATTAIGLVLWLKRRN